VYPVRLDLTRNNFPVDLFHKDKLVEAEFQQKIRRNVCVQAVLTRNSL